VARERTPLNGYVHIKAWEKQADGSEKLIKDDTIKNLVVTVGKDAILKFLGNITGGGYVDDIGVGDSTTAAAVGQTDLQGTAVWKTIVTADRVFITPTLYISTEFGYSEANFTWNEMGIRDNQGTPILWARQIDASPLVKTTSKRAIVEWQLSM